MKSLFRTATVACVAALLSATAQAAIVTSKLTDVTILGSLYDVTFVQRDTGMTSFNDVFGLAPNPSLTFNASNAQSATAAVLAAVNAARFDVDPSPTDPTFMAGFALAFSVTSTAWQYYTAYPTFSPTSPGTPLGTFATARTSPMFVSFATFQQKDGSVPEPGTFALAGLAAALAVAVARRRA